MRSNFLLASPWRHLAALTVCGLLTLGSGCASSKKNAQALTDYIKESDQVYNTCVSLSDAVEGLTRPGYGSSANGDVSGAVAAAKRESRLKAQMADLQGRVKKMKPPKAAKSLNATYGSAVKNLEAAVPPALQLAEISDQGSRATEMDKANTKSLAQAMTQSLAAAESDLKKARDERTQLIQKNKLKI